MDDHLYSFKRYVDGVEFFYCEFYLKLPRFLQWINWDGVILHYTLLAERWDPTLWPFHREQMSAIGKLKGHKVAIPQDEYAEVTELQKLLKKCGVETVFTCLSPVDYSKIYPFEKTGIKHFFQTCPGFVDENSKEAIERLSKENKTRDIDIGYRARELPFWLGRHGQIKKEIADQILQTEIEHNLKLDISIDPKDVFYGDDWMRFLLRSRCVLGCLGGASLYDPDGEIRKKVDEYVKENPQAPFEEVEQKIFPGKDFSLNLFALSPRHFECALTKTCQILVEGDYRGIFIPGRHFIELKRDYSNLEEILKKITDHNYCEQIAENAYYEIGLSNNYTYKAFANQVVDHIKKQSIAPRNRLLKLQICRILLKIQNRTSSIRFFLFRAWRKYHFLAGLRLRRKERNRMSKVDSNLQKAPQ